MSGRGRAVALAVCAAAVLSVANTAMQRPPTEWPEIRATEAQLTFVDPGKDDADTPFRLLLRDTNGNTVYRLECHNGNYEGASEITFSGDFHCALFAVTGDLRRSGNLLAEDTEAQGRSDWLNRGRMIAAQLRGQCAATPYGTTRVFRLRGMRANGPLADELSRGCPCSQRPEPPRWAPSRPRHTVRRTHRAGCYAES